MRQRIMLVLAACMVGGGCKGTQTGVTSSPPTALTSGGSSRPFWDSSSPSVSIPPPASQNLPPSPATRDAQSTGLLAGRLVDPSGQGVRNAFIRVSLVSNDSSASGDFGPTASKTGVDTDEQGYFIIPGLRRNQTYQLSVQHQDGVQTLAAVTQTRPPNSRLLLKLRGDAVSSLTAPPPPHPGMVGPYAPKNPGANDGPTNLPPPGVRIPDTNDPPPPAPTPDRRDPPFDTPTVAPPSGSSQDRAWTPGPPPARGVNPGFAPPSSPDMTKIAEGPRPEAPIRLEVPGRNPAPTPRGANYAEPAPDRPPPAAPMSYQPRAPSNLNVRLTTLNGEAWDFSDREAPLVLLDFWSTSCVPCLRALPEVKRLALEYPNDQLQVVGVALDSGPWQQRWSAVSRVAFEQQLNYLVLLEPERATGQIRSRFGIRSIPTLVLVDGQGQELWRGSPQEMYRLRQILNQRIPPQR